MLPLNTWARPPGKPGQGQFWKGANQCGETLAGLFQRLLSLAILQLKRIINQAIIMSQAFTGHRAAPEVRGEPPVPAPLLIASATKSRRFSPKRGLFLIPPL